KFRAMAKARGLTLEALGRAAEKDPSIDRALDRAIVEEIRAKEAARTNVVVDGRIEAHLLTREGIPCLNALIDAPVEVRAQRIAQREKRRVAEGRREVRAREGSERSR